MQTEGFFCINRKGAIPKAFVVAFLVCRQLRLSLILQGFLFVLWFFNDFNEIISLINYLEFWLKSNFLAAF